ncbi:protein bride of sevenless isoform X2 [Phymastichus coffea]|uniref:protein bride of sevenless isoform X2 n=1 Tax=Phymastichus coffea TaxID=108790 RepID=UPI00273CD9A1|nr:protein bride of sevenless isoform X2 [Phymastichus coffea]
MNLPGTWQLVLLSFFGLALAIEDLVCSKNHSVVEVSGDAVLSVFVDTDYGPECNISSPKSIQEVATAMFVAQSLNKLGYVPGVTIGMRLYDTCNDRISVYKQALLSAMEMDCSAHYDLGILAPERYSEVLEPLRNLDIIPVNTYASANLSRPLIDVLVDFIASRYSVVDLVLSSSRRLLDRFLDASKEAGICVKSDKMHEPDGNATDLVVVAIGDYDDVSAWLDEEQIGDHDDKKIWIILPVDNSHVDDLIPESSFVVKPEQFQVDLGPELDMSEISVSTILHSPHLLSVGKAIVEIAKSMLDLQTKSCPYGTTGCVLPRFSLPERASISNAHLYEILRVPAKSHSTKYIIARKLGDAVVEIASYMIDATSARYRVMPEREMHRMPRLCVKKLASRCDMCINFQIRSHDEDEYDDDDYGDNSTLHNLKPNVWVPIFLTIVSCGTLACACAGAFIVYRYFVEEILDGNPLMTLVLIVATVLMLQSIVPFCLEDKVMGAQHLNARKIYVSSLSFGLAFSVMLTRALFLAFTSCSPSFTSHINGYLQGCMLLFMAGVEIAISTMYFALSTNDAARVMRGPVYIALLGYDIFLLVVLFVTCCFIAHIPRNYREGMCFFGTAIGLLMTWAVWLTCFFLMSAEQRDVIVCYGILGTACLIIVGILVPRTYFMLSHYSRTGDKDFMGRFEVADLPDPRMNNAARQSRQPFYEYVQQQPPSANYYGSTSPNKQPGSARGRRNQRSPEPRRTPGYNNYGFRPEMRELEQAYVIPRLYVDDPNVSRIQSVVKSEEPLEGPAAQEARYALPRSLLRKARGLAGSINRKVSGRGEQQQPTSNPNARNNRPIETEVYVQDRISPRRLGPDEHFPPLRSPSPKLTPTHTSIREEDEIHDYNRITRF